MKKHTITFGFVLLAILLAGVLACALRGRAVRIDEYSIIDRPAKISPDYSSTVIPPNISPLNFVVKEKGTYYAARIYSEKGEPIEVFSRSPKILIPMAPWHELLDKNRGDELHFDIFVRGDNQQWTRFGTISNSIAREDIDNYLVYRRTHPTYILTKGQIVIYQRDLRSFDEKMVVDNRHYKSGCVSCHTFVANRPEEFLMSIRNVKYGPITLLIKNGKVSKIVSKFGYSSWHPSGKVAAYSLNRLPMFFHTAKKEVRDTVDVDSTLAYFDVNAQEVKIAEGISKKDRLETWPCWSADGRFLYFTSAPISWTDIEQFPPKEYEKIKYDLVRISYDVENDKWGKPETVLSGEDTGRSIAMPRVSPDGRWIIICMYDYGAFPPWQASSDLYIMDLKAAETTGKYEYHRMEINSDQSEAWHGWSSNSRWIVFSSKRDYGAFTRSYISYVDETGKAYKPLVLPQKDPAFYDSCLDIFSSPEFVTGPITVSAKRLASAIRSAGASVKMPAAITMATPKAGGAKPSKLELE